MEIAFFVVCRVPRTTVPLSCGWRATCDEIFGRTGFFLLVCMTCSCCVQDDAGLSTSMGTRGARMLRFSWCVVCLAP
jgi:hypothetical protein